MTGVDSRSGTSLIASSRNSCWLPMKRSPAISNRTEYPALYRIHEPPAANRLAEFEEIASHFGYSLTGVPGDSCKEDSRSVTRHRDGRKTARETTLTPADFTVSSRAYQRLIAKLEGKPEERILTYLMLRSLKQAKYSEENKGHFALAAPIYTHFTSPIRRYPDLIVHRVLGAWLENRNRQLLRIGSAPSLRSPHPPSAAQTKPSGN